LEAGGKYLAFPFGYSPVLVAYNPKYVKSKPDSWAALWDPKYKGKNRHGAAAFDVMAMMASPWESRTRTT